MAPTVTTMPRNVATGVISFTRRSPREIATRPGFDAVEPPATASVDTSRDGVRASTEERESTGKDRTERSADAHGAQARGSTQWQEAHAHWTTDRRAR